MIPLFDAERSTFDRRSRDLAIVVRRLLSTAAGMGSIERYQTMLHAATATVESDPRAVGRWLLGLAILLEGASQQAPAMVAISRPWAHALADEAEIIASTRARVAHQVRILAAESLHVCGLEHRRDFYARVRELMAATRDANDGARWIGLEPLEVSEAAPPIALVPTPVRKRAPSRSGRPATRPARAVVIGAMQVVSVEAA